MAFANTAVPSSITCTILHDRCYSLPTHEQGSPLNATPDAPAAGADERVFRAIAQRTLWIATSIVDAANNGRPNTGVKVGGHPASCASIVDIMVAPLFHALTAADRASVKPCLSWSAVDASVRPFRPRCRGLTSGCRYFLSRLRQS